MCQSRWQPHAMIFRTGSGGSLTSAILAVRSLARRMFGDFRSNCMPHTSRWQITCMYQQQLQMQMQARMLLWSLCQSHICMRLLLQIDRKHSSPQPRTCTTLQTVVPACFEGCSRDSHAQLTDCAGRPARGRYPERYASPCTTSAARP